MLELAKPPKKPWASARALPVRRHETCVAYQSRDPAKKRSLTDEKNRSLAARLCAPTSDSPPRDPHFALASVSA